MKGLVIKNWEIIKTGPRPLAYLLLTVLFVTVHSFLLGFFIYFFPGNFYRLFFAHTVENIFFVRQAGLFLMLSALFYLYPLLDFLNNRKIIPLIILSKTFAVIFLLTNAGQIPVPLMAFLAALGDGTMALILGFYYKLCNREKYFG